MMTIEELKVEMLANNEVEITDVATSTQFQICICEYTRGYFAAILNYGVCVMFDDYSEVGLNNSLYSCDNMIVRRYAAKLARVLIKLNIIGELSFID